MYKLDYSKNITLKWKDWVLLAGKVNAIKQGKEVKIIARIRLKINLDYKTEVLQEMEAI